MVDKAFELPEELGLFPAHAEEFGAAGAQKAKARQATFKKYNTRGDGNMTFDEWLLYAMENVMKKIVK